MKNPDRLQQLLAEEQQRMHTRVAELETELDALNTARRGSNDDDEHDPEGVTLSSEWSRLAGLLDAARSNQKQISDAFARFEAGTYGICITCQKPIPFAQLEVRPFREQCVACASRIRIGTSRI